MNSSWGVALADWYTVCPPLRMISRPHGDKPPASMRWHVTLNLVAWGRQGEGADIRVHGVGERRSGCFLRG